jgi:predicted Zn-dependent protease
MKTRIIGVIAIFAVLVFCIVASAASMQEEKVKVKGDIERIDFIHYAKPGKGAAKDSSCYSLMGVKWQATPVNYYINPTNPQGLTQTFITSAISTAAETWDATTSKELFNNAYQVDYSARYGTYDGKNSIAFGPYQQNNVIAVTSVWYNKRTKSIVEFDQLYNTYYSWGDATANSALMDLQNIATHELGHAVGLDDIYNSRCTAVTMYGYSDNGETIKRTLEQPDITGLQKMYGV